MPKQATPVPVILRKYVSTYGEQVFSTDGLILKCLAYDCKVMAEKKISSDAIFGNS